MISPNDYYIPFRTWLTSSTDEVKDSRQIPQLYGFSNKFMRSGNIAGSGKRFILRSKIEPLFSNFFNVFRGQSPAFGFSNNLR